MKNEKNKLPETSPLTGMNVPALFKNLPGMVYRCKNDEDWTMEFVSTGCIDLTGFHSADLLDNAYISYAGLIHPEDRYQVWEEVNKGIDKREPFRIVYRIVAKGGAEKWVLEQGQGVFDDNDELQAVEGFITDITEQKNAELALEKSLKEKELLLSETHHRIKNNMQLIISMLRVQMTNTPVCEDVINSVIDRIRVFADMHEELYSFENNDRIDLEKQIGNIFSNLAGAYGYRTGDIDFNLKIGKAYYELKAAIPLGLMCNEMISNSFKHALTGQSGYVKIEIKLDKAEKIEKIVYSDSGADLGNPEGGFGLLLLQSLAGQLGLNTEFVPEGSIKYIFQQ